MVMPMHKRQRLSHSCGFAYDKTKPCMLYWNYLGTAKIYRIKSSTWFLYIFNRRHGFAL